MSMRYYGVFFVLYLSAVAFGQDAPAGSVSTAPAGKGGKILKLPHLRVDLAARKILLEAEVCRQKGMLEFLVCEWGKRDYESILRTRAKPSHIHAALLALGLSPGKPARWWEGKRLPPQGAELSIFLEWKDADGKVRRAPAADWLNRGPKRAASSPKKWVFVGSLVLANGVYWADEEGEVISVSNFASSVIDVPFESSDKKDLLEFSANTNAIPAVKTPVTVIITPLGDAENADHARALLEIDRFGTMRLSGKPVTDKELAAWAVKFSSRHKKAMVYIRLAGRSFVEDAQRAREILRIAGIREFDEQRLPVGVLLLPRTERQLRRDLKEWATKFANPKDYIIPPDEQADAALKEIARKIEELEAKKKLWREYETSLRKALDAYRARDRAE